LAGDLNAKHPSWNSAVSNPSGEKLLQLFGASDFKISAPQCPIHYSPSGNGDVLDIVVCKNIRLSYRLSTIKITLSELNNDLPGLDRLLKYKKRTRKLWQETKDPGCKKAVNWVSKSIRCMTQKKALERWETKLVNTELTTQAIWPTAKSLTNRDGPRAPTSIHGLLGLKYHPVGKASTTADCIENQFTPHDLCEENHERRVEAESELC
jgi:hypothetical protein